MRSVGLNLDQDTAQRQVEGAGVDIRARISTPSALAVICFRLSVRARCRSFATDLPRKYLPKSFSSMSCIVPDAQREVILGAAVSMRTSAAPSVQPSSGRIRLAPQLRVLRAFRFPRQSPRADNLQVEAGALEGGSGFPDCDSCSWASACVKAAWILRNLERHGAFGTPNFSRRDTSSESPKGVRR